MDQFPQRKLAVIMFMDIVGYTSMVQESEQKALEFVRIHMKTIEEYAKKYNGRVVNYYGDASMSMFNSAVDAVKCAVELQRAYHNDYDLPMRVGLHMGDVVLENDTIYGNGVNIAARLESLGIPGCVLISGSINTELDNQDEFKTTLLGHYKFKNVADKVKVYAIEDNKLVVPQAKELKSDKGQFVNQQRKIVLIGSILFSLLLCAVALFNWTRSSQETESMILQEKIVVPPFKNYTGDSDINFVGEMVAHRITKELFEIEGADVIDFQTSDQIAEVKYMSFGNSMEGYTSQSGAVNVLEGNFSKYGPDSLMFSVVIKNLKGDAIVHTFEDVYFAAEDPVAGISNLTSYINGYWTSKNENLLSFPKLEAYKLYLKAKSSWYGDDEELTENLLLKAIEIDPKFYDAYDLILSHYYNVGEILKARNLLITLKDEFDDMSTREKNVIHQMDAVFNGNNNRVFKYSKIHYSDNPQDLFTNTSHMAVSNDFKHDYKETIAAFDEIDINELNITECSYCEERLGLAILAYMGVGDFDAAEEYLKLMPEAPNKARSYSIQIRYYSKTNKIANIYELMGRAEDGKFLSNQGKLVTHVNSLRYVAARELYLAGRFEEASEISKQLLTDVKDNSYISNWAHYFIGDLDLAEKGFLALIDGYRDIREYSQLGVIAAKKGQTEKAWEYIAEIEQLEGINFGDKEYYQARIYVHLGEKERALQLLNTAVKKGTRFYAFNLFENDPDLMSLRDDPEFKRIVFPMN